MPDESAGSVVSKYIADELTREQQRKNALENRAAFVLSGVSVAVSVLFAALSFGFDGESARAIDGFTEIPFFGGLILLAASGILALIAQWPQPLETPCADDLQSYMTPQSYWESKDYSERRIGEALLTELRSLSTVCDRSAAWLMWSQGLLAAGAVLCAAAAVLAFR